MKKQVKAHQSLAHASSHRALSRQAVHQTQGSGRRSQADVSGEKLIQKKNKSHSKSGLNANSGLKSKVTQKLTAKPPRPGDDQVVLEDTGGSKNLQNDLPLQRSSQTNSRKINKNEMNQYCNDQSANQIRGKNLISGAPKRDKDQLKIDENVKFIKKNAQNSSTLGQFGSNTLLGGSKKEIARMGRSQEKSASSTASIKGRKLSPVTEAGLNNKESEVKLTVPNHHRGSCDDNSSPHRSISDHSAERRMRPVVPMQSIETQSTIYRKMHQEVKKQNEVRGYDPAYRNEPPSQFQNAALKGYELSFGMKKDAFKSEQDFVHVSVGEHNPKLKKRKVSPSELPFSPPILDSARAKKSPIRATQNQIPPKPPIKDKKRNLAKPSQAATAASNFRQKRGSRRGHQASTNKSSSITTQVKPSASLSHMNPQTRSKSPALSRSQQPMLKSEKTSYTTTDHVSHNHITNLNVQTSINKPIQALVTTKNITSGGTGELDFDKRFVSKVENRIPNQQPHTAQQQSSFQLTFSKQRQSNQQISNARNNQQREAVQTQPSQRTSPEFNAFPKINSTSSNANLDGDSQQIIKSCSPKEKRSVIKKMQPPKSSREKRIIQGMHSQSVSNLNAGRNISTSQLQKALGKHLIDKESMKQMLTIYQKGHLKPAQERLELEHQRQKQRSQSPLTQKRDRSVDDLIKTNLKKAEQEKRKIKKEAIKKQKDLKAKRKAIEAKNKEIRHLNMRQQQASLIPGVQVQMINASQVNFNRVDKGKDLKTSRGPTQQQKENSQSNVPQALPLKKPQKYITARSHGLDQFEVSSFDKNEQQRKQLQKNQDLLQNHTQQEKLEKLKNMPFRRDVSASTNSREDYKVEWDPSVNKQIDKKNQNSRPQRRDIRHKADIGMEYLQVKKELANVKDVQKLKQQVKDLDDATSKAGRKEILEIGSPISDMSGNQKSDITHSEAQKLLFMRLQKAAQSVQQQSRIGDLKVQAKDAGINKDKQKSLVQIQKKQWSQKEKEKARIQQIEAQRILKNLQDLNKSARTRVQKSFRILGKDQHDFKQKAYEISKTLIQENREFDDQDMEQPSIHSENTLAPRLTTTLPLNETSEKTWDRQVKNKALNVQINKPQQKQHKKIRDLPRKRQRSLSNERSPQKQQVVPAATGASGSDIVQNTRKQGISSQTRVSYDQKKEKAGIHFKIPQPTHLYKISECVSQSNKQGSEHEESMAFSPVVPQRSQRSKSKISSRQSKKFKGKDQSESPRGTLRRGSMRTTEDRASAKRSKKRSAEPSRSQNSRSANENHSSKSLRRRHKSQGSIDFRGNNSNTHSSYQRYSPNDRSQTRKKLIPTVQSSNRSQYKQICKDLNKEELQVFKIITQAACMIQKTFRAYIARKKHKLMRDEIRRNILDELDKSSPLRRRDQSSSGVGDRFSGPLSALTSNSNSNSLTYSREGNHKSTSPNAKRTQLNYYIQKSQNSKSSKSGGKSQDRKNTINFVDNTKQGGAQHLSLSNKQAKNVKIESDQHELQQQPQRTQKDEFLGFNSVDGVTNFLNMQAGTDNDVQTETRIQKTDIAQKMPTHFSTIQNSAKETAQFPPHFPSQGPSASGSQVHSTLEPKTEQKIIDNLNSMTRRQRIQPNENASSRENRQSDQPCISSQLGNEYIPSENRYDWLRLEAGSDRSASDSAYEPVSAPREQFQQEVSSLPYSSNFPYSSKPFVHEEHPIGTYDSLNDRILISSQIKDNDMESNNSSVYSDGIRSHIIGDAGEDFSLLQIAGLQKQGDDSITETIAEKTDKIINQLGYSGVLNSSEEMMEAAVNASGTLGLLAANKSKSLTNSNSKDSQQPKISNSYLNEANSSQGGKKGPSSQRSKRQRLAYDQGNNQLPQIIPDGIGADYQSNFQDMLPKPGSLKNTQGAESGWQSENVSKTLMRAISGDEKFLINHSRLGLPNSYTNTIGNKETLFVISALGSQAMGTQAACAGLNSVNSSGDFTSEHRSQMSAGAYGMKLVNTSFQNALYAQGQSQQQNLSTVSIDELESNANFLATNASIFERNPFQDFTATRINDVLTNKQSLEKILQMKDDALKFANKLESGWISRQEKLNALSPSEVKKKRYELEEWVTQQKNLNQLDAGSSASFSSSYVKQICQQVAAIAQQVNLKSEQIKANLQAKSNENSQKEGYQDMKIFKNAIGISNGSKSIGSENNIGAIVEINVVDQSIEQEQVLEEQPVDKNQVQSNSKTETKFESITSRDEYSEIQVSAALPFNAEQKEEKISILKSGPSAKDLNSDLEISIEDQKKLQNQNRISSVNLQSPVIEAEKQDAPILSPQDESSESEITNAKLAEEVTDLILAKFLSEELADTELKTVFKRLVSQKQPANEQIISPKDRIRRENHQVEIAPEVAEKINQSSISHDQIVAGVDTSIDAVEQYIEGIFSQIRLRGKQFMNAFYTPIYKNPLIVLSNLQRANIGQANQTGQLDLTNTLSSILNVQLYLTLEKARENVIREALQQIKEATNGENMAQDDNLSELLSESDHIHNKAIFDAVNEALNMVRPYAQQGEPMPWSNRARKNFFQFATEKALEDVLKSVKENLISWADMKAGQINSGLASEKPEQPEPAKEENKEEEKLEGKQDEQKPANESSLIKQTSYHQVSEETLALQREKCLAKLLTQDIIQNEEKWLDYENEDTQVRMDLADHVLEHLVDEIVQQLQGIEEKVRK